MTTMSAPTVVHGSFTLARTYPASPARVFAAFATPETKRRWFTEGKSWEVDEFTSDFRVGGRERSRFRFRPDADLPEGAPVFDAPMGNDTVFMDIVPDRRLVFAYSMLMNETPFSASLATIELLARDGGTELVLTEHSAFLEHSDGAELREQGWRELLERLGEELAR